jgi:hypothetical protein
LFTVWDIVNHIDIEHLVTALRQVSYGSTAFKGGQDPMEVSAIEIVSEALEKCAKPFHEMGLKASAGMIRKFLDTADRNRMREDWTGDQFAEKCLAVFSAIQCETEGVFCLKLEADNVKFLDKKTPFGLAVAMAFSECSEDIEEAHQCIAFERYTAGMFHLGRAMELAVAKTAKRIKVTPRRPEWQAYLDAMNEKVKEMPFKTARQKAARLPLAEAASHFFNFKEAWRNPTFHAKKTYRGEEAVAALTNAGAFLDSVARKIFKVKTS